MSKLTTILMLSAIVAFVAAPAAADWDETMPAKWVQLPDLTPEGIDIYNMESAEGIRKILADDFKCDIPIPITDVHFWGSWKDDKVGKITSIHLSIHDDIPAAADGTEPTYSRPGEQRWEGNFVEGEFTMRPIPSPDEDWYNPNTGEYLRDNHHQAWQVNIVDIRDPFPQEGTPDQPIVYWLDIVVKVENPEEHQWGWKTAREHWNDDAVWSDGGEQWNELLYPPEHPYHNLPYPENSIDLAFVITPEPGTTCLLVLGGIGALLRRRRK